MPKHVKAIPEAFHTLTPSLVVHDAAQALEFYKKAFGAEELVRMPMPNGQSIMHAELKIGNSIFFVSDEFPGHHIKSPRTLNGSAGVIHIYSENTDAAFDRAVKAGATPTMPPADMFWGDRYASVTDPFGHSWGLATHKEDLTPEQIDKRARDWFAKMPGQK
jgi:PhnB protein